MKISIDLDGTAWRHQRFFAALARALQADGHEVGVFTAHGDNLREADLRLWRARGFPEPDFFYNHADAGERNGIPIRDWKLAFIHRAGIDCHIDDWDDLIPGQIEMVIRSR